MKKWIVIGTVLLLIGVLALVYFREQQKIQTVTSYESCVAAGYPVMESYPSICSTPDGKSFTQDIGNELEYRNEIMVDTPRPHQKIISPLTITGKARGPWFFEAQFSAELFDEHNTSLGVVILTAKGEWMTEDFVPFAGELQFATPTTKKGTLKLQSANPSGLPENQKELFIPVIFNISKN